MCVKSPHRLRASRSNSNQTPIGMDQAGPPREVVELCQSRCTGDAQDVMPHGWQNN